MNVCWLYVSEAGSWLGRRQRSGWRAAEITRPAIRNAAEVRLVCDFSADVEASVRDIVAEAKKVSLISPYVVGAGGESPDPVQSFELMEHYLRLPASLGGFRPWSPADVLTLDILQMYRKAEPAPMYLWAESERLLRRHPVWPALGYLGRVDVVAAAALVSFIVDPRWYVDLAAPDRWRRYFGALGLMPKVFWRMTRAAKAPTSRLSVVARTAMSAWAVPGSTHGGHFLWRVVERGATPQNYCRATRLFAKFLRLVWLDSVAQSGEALFVPEHFFQRPEDAEAYTQYRLASTESSAER